MTRRKFHGINHYQESILLRKPQHPDYLVEEACTRPSNRELNAGPCQRGHWLQYNERIVRWFNSPVDKRWRASRKALGK
ncbi:hypothetical protein M405DRAFT_805974 [Rhizopogon salebrosus TDB-379]|nr:hypothetical protein M405DRAFT_805974 [Rhizopogon salebrosus TDB-379]